MWRCLFLQGRYPLPVFPRVLLVLLCSGCFWASGKSLRGCNPQPITARRVWSSLMVSKYRCFVLQRGRFWSSTGFVSPLVFSVSSECRGAAVFCTRSRAGRMKPSRRCIHSQSGNVAPSRRVCSFLLWNITALKRSQNNALFFCRGICSNRRGCLSSCAPVAQRAASAVDQRIGGSIPGSTGPCPCVLG